MLYFIIFILAVASSTLGTAVYVLLKKVELYEDDIKYKDEFYDKLKSLIDESSQKMKQLDTLGAFESDDETGFFFKQLKSISLILSGYFLNYKK